jgi:hypothetical protein
MSLYVYCLGDELAEATVEGLKGVGGKSVRLLGLGRLAAVVSETEDDPVAVTDENVRAHNRVNAAALAASTPLPFRFGTRAERERLAAYASANEAALLAALGRVRGCVEMSVKLKWHEERAEDREQMSQVSGQMEAGGQTTEDGEQMTEDGGQAVVNSEEVGREGAGILSEASAGILPEASARILSEASEGAAGGGGRGTAFLLAKRRAMSGEESLRRRAEEVAAWLAAGVSGLARESAARVSPAEGIVVRAAHLVERRRVVEYRAHVRELSGTRAGLHFLTSGPWPPYSFSDIGR